MHISGEIVSITYTPAYLKEKSKTHFDRMTMKQARLVTGYGIEGDRKAGHPKRQLNILAADAVASLNAEGFKTRPGELGEQLVISGIDIDGLPVGTEIEIGPFACVQVSEVREPCARFEFIQEKHRSIAMGRIGVLAVVTRCGMINVGDPVRVVVPAAV